MSKGGMQTSAVQTMNCKCGKQTSKTLVFGSGKEISIHFTRKSTYWHITENGETKRVFKKPVEWQ